MTIEVDQAIAELQEMVKCRCDPVYTDRKRHDPDRQCDYAPEVQVIVDYIEQLISTRNYLAASADKAVALMYKEKDKLAKAVENLGRLVALNDDYSPFAGEFFHDRVERTWQTARTTLAEIKGESQDGMV
jgi:hypothetical protein